MAIIYTDIIYCTVQLQYLATVRTLHGKWGQMFHDNGNNITFLQALGL
jgi:hypothetical protein